MRVLGIAENGLAQCADASGMPVAQAIQTALLDRPPVTGEWLLVHIDTAIRLLEAGEARLIADAIDAVQLAARGDRFEHLLADLIDREPQLPAHLREPENTG
jgi:hydrogenase expression/formation protein HypC